MAVTVYTSQQYFCVFTLRASYAAQCIVIGPACGFVTAGGWAGGRCPNLTTAMQRAQCLRLSERFFIFMANVLQKA